MKPSAKVYGNKMVVDGNHSNTRYNSMKGEYNEYIDGYIFSYNRKTGNYEAENGRFVLIKENGKTVGCYDILSNNSILVGNIMQSYGTNNE